MRSSPPASRLDTPHILLVDDNRDGLIVRKALLEELGFSVYTASSGEEALALFNSASFDVIVTDYRMPQMNGTELIRKIRTHKPGVRVILLSGFVEPLGLTEEATGADIVLAKSAKEAAQLLRSVKRLLNHPPPRKQPRSQSSPSGAAPRAKLG